MCSLQTGYTVKDSACQTSCTNHNDKYNYCYLGWGSSNWDYCDPNLNGAQVTQPLGQSKGKSTDKACTSFCSGEGPLWCFAGSETSDCAPDPLPELTLQILAKCVVYILFLKAAMRLSKIHSVLSVHKR